MDGAGPIRRIAAITLPSILPVITFVLCINLGSILFAGGEQILLFYNKAVLDSADVIETWVYREGLSRAAIQHRDGRGRLPVHHRHDLHPGQQFPRQKIHRPRHLVRRRAIVIYKSRSEIIYQTIIHAIVILVALTAVFPLVYVLGMSFTTKAEMIQRNYFVIIPQEPTLEAYKRIMASSVVWHSFLISVFRSTVGPLLALMLTTVGAFVLAQRTLPGRKLFLLFVLATILLNGGMIPTYLVIKQLGLINSLWSMVLPLMVDSFGLLVIKIFIENLPDGLVESAKIDGAGEWSTLDADRRAAGRAGAGRHRPVQSRRPLEQLV